MDANGTRYTLLLGFDDWGQCTPNGTDTLADLWSTPATSQTVGVAWNESLHELTLQPRLFRFVTPENDNPPEIEDRRGAARDVYGNWYWIDDALTGILVQSSGSNETTRFWSLDTPPPEAPPFGAFRTKDPQTVMTDSTLQGLTVTTQHYLVVGMLNPSGLLIFDLHGGGAPERMVWGDVPFVPYDMTPAVDGGVWILDKENMRLWALDSQFNVCSRDQTYIEEEQQTDFFVTKDSPEESDTPEAIPIQLPAGIALDAASPLALTNPIGIESLPDGTLLILDVPATEDFSLVYRYRFGEQLGEPASLDVIQHIMTDATRFIAHDFAFVPEHDTDDGAWVPDRLAVMNSEGNQVFFFDVSLTPDGSLELVAVAEYYPVRLFGGKALVAANNVVYYDFQDRWLPVVARRRQRFVKASTLFTQVFDSKIPDCVWHRIMLDMCLPPGTQVMIESRTGNTPDELLNTAWQPEPIPYRRSTGSELPFVEQGGSEWFGTFETLFQSAHGRFLQVQLTLSGNEERSPSIRALRAYYPRFSYLDNYLPALYQEDAQSASFLERFLANTEGILTAVEDRIAAAQMLLDVRSAPADALDWLASWFGVTLNPQFDDARRRLFIQYAVHFFQMRGTIPGLLSALQLAFADCADESIFTDPIDRARRSGVRIVEHFRTRDISATVFGDPTQTTTLTFIPQSERWQVEQGAIELHRRYEEFMQEQGHTDQTIFPLEPFSDLGLEAERQHFAQLELGFVPSISDNVLWQDFLRRLYSNDIDDFNDSHTLLTTDAIASFHDITLPQNVPTNQTVLQDWFTFQSVILPMHRTAHRFTALIPLPRTTFVDAAEQQRLVELAERIIDLEKPAHTTYDVRFYYDLFRVGEVRLGYDTTIDESNRSTHLLAPAVLGQAHLVESYLAPEHPQNVSNRQVTGRDRVKRQGDDTV